jgi:hypothetical protein
MLVNTAAIHQFWYEKLFMGDWQLTTVSFRKAKDIDGGKNQHHVFRNDFPDEDECECPIKHLQLGFRVLFLSMKSLEEGHDP